MPPITLNKVSDIQQHRLQDVVSQGRITLGDKSYSVSLVNDRIKVQRQGLENLSTPQRIANGIKDFFGRLFSEGTLATRTSRLENRLQGMLQEKRQYVAAFTEGLRTSGQYLQGHTFQNFAETSAQTMSDDPEGQAFILAHLDDPAFAKDKFTGIEPHPTDSTKFVAKFGDKQIVFSDRQSSNFELRGQILKDQLTQRQFTSLGDLMHQSYLSKDDAMLVYGYKVPVAEFAEDLKACSPQMRAEILAEIEPMRIGNTTVGEVFGHVLHS